MHFNNDKVQKVADELLIRLGQNGDPRLILKAPELAELYQQLRSLPAAEKAAFGAEVNALKIALTEKIETLTTVTQQVKPIDVTAPMDVNAKIPEFLATEMGSIHPLRQEITRIQEIFSRMGFSSEESREIDDQYHVFESLNFPIGHPARDDWDTFMTTQKDRDSESFIAPPHTSTMQNRILRARKGELEENGSIAVIVADRVFRNEDLDARHEHTFYQVEGIYVAKNIHVGMLVATLQKFIEEYYGKRLKVRINPYYFPFTEPSFEFALECPFCSGNGMACKVCGGEGWIELLGCGMIHPNVMDAAGIDSTAYNGFAFGCGIDRLVMMKYGIEDVRHFESGKLEFLRQF